MCCFTEYLESFLLNYLSVSWARKTPIKGYCLVFFLSIMIFFLPPSVWVICLFDNFTNKSVFFVFVFCQGQGRYENPKTKVDHWKLQIFCFCWKHVCCTHTFAWFEGSGRWQKLWMRRGTDDQYVANNAWCRLGLENTVFGCVECTPWQMLKLRGRVSLKGSRQVSFSGCMVFCLNWVYLEIIRFFFVMEHINRICVVAWNMVEVFISLVYRVALVYNSQHLNLL